VPATLLWSFVRFGFGFAGSDELITEPISDVALPSLVYGFGLIAGNLLVPLLGAIMFERYAAIWPQRVRFFHVGFAKMVLRSTRRSLVPPPLRVLSLPALLISKALARQTARPNTASDSQMNLRVHKVGGSAGPAAAWRHEAAYLKEWPMERLLGLIMATADEAETSGSGGAVAFEDRGQAPVLSQERPSALVIDSRGQTEQQENGTDEERNEGMARTRSQLEPATVAANPAVRLYGGFTERVARVLFPYTDRLSAAAVPRPAMHMTILSNGIVENPPKELVLSGDKNQTERALCFFPFPQSMSAESAEEHQARWPNQNFVWRREDGTYAVCHCWPVKYNAEWKRQFENHEGLNPDRVCFRPRAVAEMRQAMVHVFGPQAKEVPFVFARKEAANSLPVLVGHPGSLIAYLRAHPRLSKALGILKLMPDGFIARIVDKKGNRTSKAMYLATGPQADPCVLYVKQGWETMPMTKPVALFDEDSTLGLPTKLVDALAKLDALNDDLRVKMEERENAAKAPKSTPEQKLEA